jgi:hypothetical protein
VKRGFEQAIGNIYKAKSLLESKLNPVVEQEKDSVIASHYVYSLVQVTQILKHSTGSILQSIWKKGPGFIFKRFPDSRLFPLILAPVMGNIYSKTGDYSTALNYYRSGIAIALGNDGKRTSWTTTVAKPSLLKMGQLDSSIFYANKVLELSKVAHFLIKN